MLTDPLFIAMYAVALLFVGSNAVALHRHGSRLLTPGFGIGKSMEPAIPRGLTAYVEHFPRTIEEGDIVTYEDDGMAICHRVVAVDGDRIQIQGDNNAYPDGWFDKSVVTGKIWCPNGEPLWIPLSPHALRVKVEGWME